MALRSCRTRRRSATEPLEDQPLIMSMPCVRARGIAAIASQETLVASAFKPSHGCRGVVSTARLDEEAPRRAPGPPMPGGVTDARPTENGKHSIYKE